MLLRTVTTALLLAAFAFAQNGDGKLARAFGGGEVDEIVWVRLDKGDRMLETLKDIIAEKGIKDGVALSAVGGLETCKFHGVGGTMTTVEEPVELLHLSGLIVDSEPHFHVIVSNKARGAFGGHLEDNCVVLSQVEISLAKFKGPAMTRKQGPQNANALQPK